MTRGACGSNDHPDSNLFIQVFRLISTYSLIKPSKGSNTVGDEILTTLIQGSEIIQQTEKYSAEFATRLNSIMENSVWFTDISAEEVVLDHDYSVDRSDLLIAYFAGYMARKSTRFSKCVECHEKLKIKEPTGKDKLRVLLSHGQLIYTSELLFQLTKTLETTFLQVVQLQTLNIKTILNVAEALEHEHVPLVGCSEHAESLTETLIRFFLISRMFILCKTVNSINKTDREKTKLHRKFAKF